jgi:hypothetical protein
MSCSSIYNNAFETHPIGRVNDDGDCPFDVPKSNRRQKTLSTSEASVVVS